jgi:hypothetical protein
MMTEFKTLDRDVRTLRLSFALQLFDLVTGADELQGALTVRLKNQPLRKPYLPFVKTPEATFLFFALPEGNYTARIESDTDTPYYLPREIGFSVPRRNELWPAIPEFTLADPRWPLDDLRQPETFRKQLAATLLRPTTAYPFPEGATLIRGVVMRQDAPLPGAAVEHVESGQAYLTGPQGEYVLYFADKEARGQEVTVRARHADFDPLQHSFKLRRGVTVVQNFLMAT